MKIFTFTRSVVSALVSGVRGNHGNTQKLVKAVRCLVCAQIMYRSTPENVNVNAQKLVEQVSENMLSARDPQCKCCQHLVTINQIFN